MTQWHIAQMNVATALYPLDDPRMDGFVSRLDEVNALADHSRGFVWRLQSGSGNATDIQVSDDPKFIVNMSVWDSIEALFDFVYRSDHRAVMVRRRAWFERPVESYHVLWWVRAGHRPTVEEGMKRLDHLRAHGPTATAFNFKTSFPAPDLGGDARDMAPEPYCVGWR